MSADVFHDHLDVCTRCASQPFNLCSTGSQALRQAVGAAPEVAEPPPIRDIDIDDLMQRVDAAKADHDRRRNE